MAKKPLTVVLYYKGEQVETLPQEARDRISERLTVVMSAYFSAHPEEYSAVKDIRNKEEA